MLRPFTLREPEPLTRAPLTRAPLTRTIARASTLALALTPERDP